MGIANKSPEYWKLQYLRALLLQSAIICKKVQELSNGNLNFINVSSQFYNNEIAEFDFVVSWILQEGVYKEKITLIDPSGEAISSSEKQLEAQNYFFTSITTFTVEFEKSGVYYISIGLDEKEFMKIPVIISSIDTE